MLSEVFYWIMNMSIIGTAAGLLVLLLRKVRVLPRFAVYLIWLVPLIRLWVPFGLSYRYSLLNFISRFTTKTVPLYGGGNLPELVITNYMMAAQQYGPVVYKTAALEWIFRVASLLWVVVFAALVIAMLLLYYFTMSELRGAVRIRDNIYLSGSVTAPAVYGIVKPRIILPEKMAEEDLSAVVLHETAHIRRKDNLVRGIAILTACLHWYNPASWIFLKAFFEDMELACDAAILRGMDPDGRRRYAASLLQCSAAGNKGLFVSAFGGAKIRVRIEHILSYRSLGRISAIALFLLLAAIAVVLLTNAQG